jgi:Ni,Fe-hydrogenase maturation factor
MKGDSIINSMPPKTIYYFGNPYIGEDSLAIKVAEAIKSHFPKLEFKHISSTFELIDLDLSNALLLDVADVPKTLLVNTEKIIPPALSSTHDFDLGFFLKLENKNANIIVIPKNYNQEKAIEEVKEILNSLPNQS